MSAFIVSKDCMDRVIATVWRNLPEYSTAESCDQLGRALYALNLAAVLCRYPNDTKETAPGPGDLSDIHENYRADVPRFIKPLDGYKAIRCFLYQCSEGEKFETDPLFKRLDDLSNRIARDVVSTLPDYSAAAWD